MVVRVPRQQYRLEVHAVEEGVDPTRRLDVQRIAGQIGNRVGEIERDAQLAGSACPKRFHRQPVGQVLVMNRGQCRARVAKTRSMFAARVRDER